MIKRQRPSRQIIACIIVIFLIMCAFLVFTKENERRILEQNMEYIQDSTIQIGERIDHAILDGYDNIRILSAFLSESLDQPEVDVRLVRGLIEDSVFDFIEFVDRDGMDHNITGGVSDARDRQYYLDGMKGNDGLEVIFDSRATHETLLMFYSPVTFEGEIVGVLIGVYQADNKLAKMLAASYFGEPADLYLCMPEGRVVASDQPLDTNEELYIADLVQDDGALAQTMQNGDTLPFTPENQKAGGCMVKMQETGWLLVQIFPEAANVTMVHDANRAGIRFEIMLLLIFSAVLVLLIHFHRKERKNIVEVAEERGEYKNAVLADAIIVFEANLTKNLMQEGIWKNRGGDGVPLGEVLGMELPCDYDTYIVRWANTYVDEGSRDLFLENTNRMYLNRQFEQGKSEITFDYYARSLEGEQLYVRRSTYLAADRKSGDVIAYNNVKDITDQKRKEDQMQQYEQMLVMTASGIYQGAWQVDLSDFSAVYLSFEKNHITPSKKEEWYTWLGRQESYVHPDDVELLKERLSIENMLAMPVGGTFRFDFRSARKSSSGLHKVYSTNVFKVERDGKLYVNIVTMDNTASVENEMQQKALIEDALLRAENANQAKTKFLSDMSHDIRTPMNAILGFTEIAWRNIDDTARLSDCLEKIQVSGRQLLQLINNILDMTKIENGAVSLTENCCDLRECIERASGIFQAEIDQKHLTVRTDTSALKNNLVYCDGLRLNQILFNLLSNAIKFSKPDGNILVTLKQEPCAIQEYAAYELHVKDNGIGMSPEFLARIFEPFEREHTSTISQTQGTGLGMSITKNLVDLMGGTIHVTSEPGQGTEFVVQFTFRLQVQEQQPEQDAAAKAVPADDFSGKRLLLVDDNELNMEIAEELLCEAGFLVETALDGQIAVEMVKNSAPGYYDAILMDIQMPVMDGYEASRKIRGLEDRELASIPIIALTANAFDEDKKEALSNGMNAHIAKPLDIPVLYETLESIFKNR